MEKMKKLLEALSGVVLGLISLLITLLGASEDESLSTTVVRAILTFFLLLSWLPFIYSMVSFIIDINTITQTSIPNTPLNPGEFENIAGRIALEYTVKAIRDAVALTLSAVLGLVAFMIYRWIAGSLGDVASTTPYSSA
jgi:hypothetical protein